MAITCGRSGDVSRLAGPRTTRPRSAIAAGSASSSTGICTTKIDRHENASVSRPPITGPSAAPATPAAAHRRAPARSAPVASTSSSRLPTITSAPPTAWAARAAISTPSDGATAHTVVAAAKPTRPTAVATAGSPRTHTRAAGTATSASTRLNAIRTHATSPDLGPEVPQDLRQRERHHARVAEHHGDDEHQRRDDAAGVPPERLAAERSSAGNSPIRAHEIAPNRLIAQDRHSIGYGRCMLRARFV